MKNSVTQTVKGKQKLVVQHKHSSHYLENALSYIDQIDKDQNEIEEGEITESQE